MKIKPTKWRRFSLCAGKPKVEIFHIGDKNVPSIRDEEQKFLGKLLFFSGKPEETLNYIKDTLQKGVDNIEKAMVRKEFKLWIYSKCFSPQNGSFLLFTHLGKP